MKMQDEIGEAFLEVHHQLESSEEGDIEIAGEV